MMKHDPMDSATDGQVDGYCCTADVDPKRWRGGELAMDQLDQLGKKVAMDVVGTWVINRLPLPYVSISVVVYLRLFK